MFKTNTTHKRSQRTHILHNGQQHKISTQNQNMKLCLNVKLRIDISQLIIF